MQRKKQTLKLVFWGKDQPVRVQHNQNIKNVKTISLVIISESKLTAWMEKNKSASQLKFQKYKEKAPSSGQTKT